MVDFFYGLSKHETSLVIFYRAVFFRSPIYNISSRIFCLIQPAQGAVSLGLWHAAHRLRTALYGLGLRADGTVSVVGYGIIAYYLLQI